MLENQADTLTLPPVFSRQKQTAEPPAIGPPSQAELQQIATARAKRLQTRRDTLLRSSAELKQRAAFLRHSLAEAEAALKRDQTEAGRLTTAIDNLRAGSEPFEPTPSELKFREAVLRQRAALAVYQDARQAMDECAPQCHPAVWKANRKPILDHAAAIDAAENASQAVSKAFNAFADAREAVRTAQYALETESQSL